MKTCARRATVLLCLFGLILTGNNSPAQEATKKPVKKKEPNPAYAKVIDDPSLPRVLLIGDSISIGYTVATQELLAGKANVHRIPTNGGPTINGIKNIDKWLGESKWDVIHFNWGLHDLKKIDGQHQVSIEEYEKNLSQLTQRLKQTGATLIWCNTTPVPPGSSPPREPDDVLKYNEVAAKVMKENQVATNNLYKFAQKRLSDIQRPANVHFTPDGSSVLAKKVAKTISKALADETSADEKAN